MGRGIAWRYTCQAVSAAGGLFLVGFAFRRLGASTYGAYALVITVLGLLGTVDYGLNMSVVRAAAVTTRRSPCRRRHRQDEMSR